jgi:hypothetical protein
VSRRVRGSPDPLHPKAFGGTLELDVTQLIRQFR